MINREPSHFERRILLATVGLVPQVLTETLYALAVRGQPSFVPTEIHVVTTEEGRDAVTLSLLDRSTAVLAQFAHEFDLPVLTNALVPNNIHVIRDITGNALTDIDSGADNEAAANCITTIVRELTKDENAALHVSIAGGRKTISFLLGHALTLFGRAQDRLSHVLVERDLENHPQFFYPPLVPRVLYNRDGRPINTANAKLALANIEFLRLRYFLPQTLLDGNASFSETIASTQTDVTDPELIIDMAGRLISCHGITFTLQPLPFAIYAWLARRRQEQRDGDGATHWSEADPDELLTEYRSLPDLPIGAVGEQQQRWKDGIPSDTLEQNKAKINSALRRALGRMAEPYLIQACGLVPRNRRRERIGLKLAPEVIAFSPLQPPDQADAP